MYALKYHNISAEEFYHVLKLSSLNKQQFLSILYNSSRNDDITLTYCIQKLEPQTMSATIQCCQIALTALCFSDKYNIYLNNVMMNYMIDVAKQEYFCIIPEFLELPFRLKMYSTIWYRSNMNVYMIFCLYLVNIGIIHYNLVETILSNTSNISSQNDKILSYIFHFLHLFRFNNGLAILLYSLLLYLATAGIYISRPTHRDILMYLYHKVKCSSDIADEIKNKTLHQLSLCLDITTP
jgi:hypothetical protein